MEDSPKAVVKLNGEFTAQDLEAIIRDLAQVRAGMQPAVPTQRPSGPDDDLLVQEETLFTVHTLADGGVRIWLRNEGLGWMGFTLTAEGAAGLREFFGKKIGHTHTAH